jgi:uncharacterized membrane protein YhaH (DUF805 family)
MEKPEKDYNMIDWWKKVFLKNYANFNGRARRSEYWYFSLASLLIFVPFYILAIAGISNDEESLLSDFSFGVITLLMLAIIVPSLAVTVRRLHDTNKSGWYYFITLIPLGSIILLVWLFTEGDSRANKYGDDPKNPGLPEFDFDQDPI